MVTIEQKMILFSRLIYQLMNAEFKGVLKNLEADYNEKLEKNKRDIDSEVKKIVNNAHKKRDLEVSKIHSTLRINEKKEYMLIREKYYNKFMDRLKAYIYEFVKSEGYKSYLLRLINGIGLKEEAMHNPITPACENNCIGINIKDISLYMTSKDYDLYSELLSAELKKFGYEEGSYRIDVSNDNIIGGFIIEDNIDKFRIDLSIKSLLDDNKDFIMKILFEALEAGEKLE